MALETEIPLVPKSAPYELQPVFVGAFDDKCSVRHFRDFLPDSWGCEEISSEKKWATHLRAFWYPEKGSQPPVDSIQRKIQAFLFSLENVMPGYWGMTALVQFWAPTTTKDGMKTLSVSKQPFAVRQNWKGLCRYRFYCQELSRIDSRNSDEIGPNFGPVGRAFTRGSVEFSPKVDIYSEENFPLKNPAKHCGVVGYLALPVFEVGNGDSDGQQGSCVGVLEFVSFSKDGLSHLETRICLRKLKEVGLAFRYPSHSEAIAQIRPHFNFTQDTCKGKLDELRSLMYFVRKRYGLPLLQIWLPCICNGSEVSVECEPNSDSFSKVTHLVCGLQCLDREERKSAWLSSYAGYDSQLYFVEDGESWVGRAHSLKKICFIKDIRQYSIMDYPLVTLGHSSDLLACYAVPLQLVNPKLPPLVLEVFLPTQYNFDADQGAILKRIMSTFALELSKYNADFGLRKDDEYFIDISHSEDDYGCVFLDMSRGLLVVEEYDVQHQPHQPNDETEIEELQVPTGENSRPYLLPCKETTAGGSTLKRKCSSSREIRPTRPRNDELPTLSVDSSDDEEQQSGIRHSSDAVDDSCTLIVRARHNDDFVRFPFSSNSGIEGLRGDLLKRFELIDGGFRIKYQDDDGYWITLSCSEDLSLYMQTLQASWWTTIWICQFSQPPARSDGRLFFVGGRHTMQM